MTLGCGGWGGNITSDNISPRHLLNIKRLAYEVRPAAASATLSQGTRTSTSSYRPESSGALPQAPPKPDAGRGIPAQALAARIDQFLSSRGFGPSAATQPRAVAVQGEDLTLLEFVSEEDVRVAIKAGRKLLIGEKTIVTPSARDLGDAQKVFVQADWRA
jgi:acetaldehyde dehydrogenase (acetylating)